MASVLRDGFLARPRWQKPALFRCPPRSARVKRPTCHVLKLGFGYASIVNSPLALNGIKLRIGGDDARQPNRLSGIDLLLARLGFVGSRTNCSTLCRRINRIADYFPRQLRCYLPAGATLSSCWVNEQDFLHCAGRDGSWIDP